jgi:hypothetical protein
MLKILLSVRRVSSLVYLIDDSSKTGASSKFFRVLEIIQKTVSPDRKSKKLSWFCFRDSFLSKNARAAIAAAGKGMLLHRIPRFALFYVAHAGHAKSAKTHEHSG